MTRSLAISLASNVCVDCISPGAVATRWWAWNEERMHGFAFNLPLEEEFHTGEYPDAILFQLTQSLIMGQVFVIDNGQTL